jgi:hypothetical protein
MSDSREQLILAEVLARLNGTARGPSVRPSGLTVDRSRMLELKPEKLPHASIYPLVGDTSRKGTAAESALTMKIAIWVKGSNASPVDKDMDPIWQWIHQQLFADESLGGLSMQIHQIQKVWGFALHQAPFGDLDLHYQVIYRHSPTDPTSQF